MNDITLRRGRPESLEGREAKEIRCYELLDSLGIEYMQADHERAETMAVCEEIDKVLDATICKNLLHTLAVSCIIVIANLLLSIYSNRKADTLYEDDSGYYQSG